jgi:hypothetical protein
MVEKVTKRLWLGGLPAAGLDNLKGRAREETAAYLEKCTDDEVAELRADLEAERAELKTRLQTVQSSAATSETAQRQEIVVGALEAFDDRK